MGGGAAANAPLLLAKSNQRIPHPRSTRRNKGSPAVINATGSSALTRTEMKRAAA
jgi:hypothetical protein